MKKIIFKNQNRTFLLCAYFISLVINCLFSNNFGKILGLLSLFL